MRSRFSQEIADSIVEGVRDGLTIGEAAERSGVAEGTIRNWLSEGRAARDAEHSAFASAVDAAREYAASAEVSEQEFHERLARAVRSGSIQALRLWWSIHGQDRDEERPESKLDRLIARRNARLRTLDNGSGEGEAA